MFLPLDASISGASAEDSAVPSHPNARFGSSAQADQESAPESTYQAQFDTVNDEWTTVQLPWHEFVPVKRAQVLPWFAN